MSEERPAINQEGAERFEAGMKAFLELQQQNKTLIDDNGKLTKAVRLAELERDKLTLDLADAQTEVAKARAEMETAIIARVRYEEGLETIRSTLARLQPPSAPLTPPGPGGGQPGDGLRAEASHRESLGGSLEVNALRPPAEAPDAPHNSVRVEEVTRAATAVRDRQRLPRGYSFEAIPRAPAVDLDRLEAELAPPPIPQRLVVYRRPEERMIRPPSLLERVAAKLGRRPPLQRQFG